MEGKKHYLLNDVFRKSNSGKTHRQGAGVPGQGDFSLIFHFVSFYIFEPCDCMYPIIVLS